MKIKKNRVSSKAWGDVDKGALGKALADAFAGGKAGKAVIREVYAFVPDDAFGKDAEGKPTFAYSKAWGPHHEVIGQDVVLNRSGLGGAAAALAGARSEPSLDDAAKVSAKRHLRRHYKAIKEEPPEGLAETSRKIERGRAVEEMVKGSLNYTLDRIRTAFYAQFRSAVDEGVYLEEVFADYVIASFWQFPPDEFYLIRYEADGPSTGSGQGFSYTFTFAPQEEWELVELAYKAAAIGSADVPGGVEGAEFVGEGLGESRGESQGGGKSQNGGAVRRRFVEVEAGHVELVEGAEYSSGDGRRRVRAVGITADVVNGNMRRYSTPVLVAALDELRSHLHESAGQGRFLPVGLLGEAEHPSMKGGRPNLLETVVKWEQVSFDGQHVLIEGAILPTSKGKDILALMEGGVMPGISQRGYGESRFVDEAGQRVEEVTELHITGYDLVIEPSDPEAGVTILESQQEVEMDPKVLQKFIADNPQLFEGLIGAQVAAQVVAMGADQLKKLEESLRSKLGVGPEADLGKALAELVEAKKQLDASKQQEAAEAKKKLDESKRLQTVDVAIAEATKDLPYGELNANLVEAVKAAAPATAEAVKTLVESKRKEYDAIMAKARLSAMGFQHGGVHVLGPVLERDSDHPEYARGAFEFMESLIVHGHIQRRDLRKPKTINEIAAARMLARFDKVNQVYLSRETRQMQEAELATDLNLPYSVSRAILAAVWPQLIATSIFDTDVTDQAPSRVYYETYAGESGSSAAITAEDFTADTGVWVSLAHKMLQPGTVVITSHTPGTTYTEGTDYVIDYINGAIKGLAGLPEALTHAAYTYDVVREGENTAIQRGKVTLGYATLEIAANRLAMQVTNEAVVFARSQIGWDATTRVLASLVNQLRRKIDKNLMYNALAASLSVASNSGGSWNHATGPIIDFISYIGVSKVLVAARFYNPDWVLVSATNSDRIGNWDGFTAAGQRPDSDLNANGYVGRIKGLPVFQSTEFSDSYALVGNREIVMYRIYQPMTLKGPYPSYSSDKLVAADQWYAEQYDGALTPVTNKASHVVVT
jgi:hypothetical protein